MRRFRSVDRTGDAVDGAGADVAQRIASPMIGGQITLLLMTLLIVPAAYVTARSVLLRVRRRNGPIPGARTSPRT